MRRWTVVAALALALAAAGVATAVVLTQRGPSEKLQALRTDPMGQYTPADGDLVRIDAQDERRPSALAKPQPASHGRLFSLPPGSGEARLRAAIDAARAAGWTLSDEPYRALGAVVRTGSKRLPTGEATLSLTLYEDATTLPDDVPAPALKVDLVHGGG